MKTLQYIKNRGQISWPLFILVFFGFSSFILPGFLGFKPYFDHRALYPVIMMITVYLATQLNPMAALKAVKLSILVFLAASLAYIVIDSSRVLAPGYKGWLPGISSRFWGLAPHANSIGPMAALLIFLEFLCPARHKIVRLGIFACAFAVLLLAQSKTAIAATGAGLGIVLFAHIRYRHVDTPMSGYRLHAGHLLLLGVGIAGFASLLILSNLGLIDRLLNRLDSIGVTSTVQTMSGRAVIWEAALREYWNNPVFGYGPTLWSDEYRREIGLSYAYHAHNQIFQTMAASGTSGLVGLLAFLLLATFRAIQTYRVTRGVSIAVLVLIGFRVMTEVPLSPVGIANGEMLAIVALLSIWNLYSNTVPLKVFVGRQNKCTPLPSRS